MSLNESGNPLRIELKASRLYPRLILYTHLSTAILILSLSWWSPWVLVSLPLIALSLRHACRCYREDSAWQTLRCWRDGRVERLQGEGRLSYHLQGMPTILPWVIILPLASDRRRRQLPLLVDAMSAEQWSALRRWLRFGLD